jgi:DNA-binding CsgD family transcriptional regulator
LQGAFAVVLVGTDGSGKTEALDVLVAAVEEADRPVLRLRGRRLEAGEALGALADVLAEIDRGADGESQARDALVERLGQAGVLVVDDAQWLDPASARVVAGVAERAAERGLGVVVARRSGLGSDELAPLEMALSRVGRMVTLQPLAFDDAAERVARTLDAPADDRLVDALLELTAGHLHLLDLLVESWGARGMLERGALVGEIGPVSPDVVERLRPRIEQLEPDERSALEALCLGGNLDDDLLTAVASIDRDALGATMIGLGGSGLMVPGKPEVVPLVTEVVVILMPEADRRRFHARLLDSLGARPLAPGVRAEHLVASGAVGDDVAQSFLEAGDAELAEAPPMAGVWYERAAEVGADPGAVAPRRAHVEALVGDPEMASRLADGAGRDETEWARPVVAATAAASLHPDRWADVLLAAESVEVRVAAAPALFASGSVESLRALVEECRATGGPDRPAAVASALAVAEAMLSILQDDPTAALTQLSRAAQLLETAGAGRVLGDSPHALGAVLALLSLDFAAAEHLLRRAIDHEVGGKLLRTRHQLLLGWCVLRSGQWTTAETIVARTDAEGLFPRDELVLRGLEAGLARRSADVAGLAAAWKRAESAVLRAPADLFALEMLGEIGIAAGRLDVYDRVAGQIARLDALVDSMGAPSMLAVPRLWMGVQRAVANDDPVEVARLAGEMQAIEPSVGRHRALIAAAAMWVEVLKRSFDKGALERTASDLAEVGLAWEASRLTGQAAIRSSDASVTRALLGKARDMIDTVPSADDGRGVTASALSDRELDVARLVVDGLTYKEIGGQLYISPKTVEHHVAKIRQKLGATTRAEMLAALKSELL